MVKAMEQEQESLRSRLFHFKGMLENTRSHTKSLSIKSAGDPAGELERPPLIPDIECLMPKKYAGWS